MSAGQLTAVKDQLRHFIATRPLPVAAGAWTGLASWPFIVQAGYAHGAYAGAAPINAMPRERPSWEADVPLDRLAEAGFPVLVLSGGHSAAFEAVCDVLADALSAEREVIPGRGHTVPSTGEPYNRRLEAFLRAAE